MSRNASALNSGPRVVVRDLLLQTDRVRRIDHVIDYFGGRGVPRGADSCGDLVLERPGDERELLYENHGAYPKRSRARV